MLASACFCVQEQKAVLVVKGIVCEAPPWLPLDSWCSLKEEFLKTIVPHSKACQRGHQEPHRGVRKLN